MVEAVQIPVETPPVEPVVAPVVSPAETPVLFDDEGNFTENWTHTLKDKALHDDPTLKTIRNLDGLASVTVNTKAMVGKDTIAVLTETSSEAEIEAFHRAGGRPDTVNDYNLKAPDGFPEDVTEKAFPKERLSVWQDRFFKAGISKKAADEFIANFAQDMLVDLQRVKEAEEQQMSELKSGLSIEYGAAMAQKKHIGDIAIEEGTKGDFDFKTRLTEKFGNDPDFIRYSVNLGEKFAEGKSPNLTNIPTPSDLQSQIEKIMENPLYLKGTQKERMKLAEQVLALREKMNTEAGIT